MTETETKTATLITDDLNGFTGQAAHYRLDPPLDGAEFVVVSATVAMFSGPETYIFAADESGKITDFSEKDGSYRGGLDHAEALEGAGYAVA